MTGTCPGGLAYDNPAWRPYAEAIAQTISWLRPREFVELEVGPLSPIPFLGNVTSYVCAADKRLAEALRAYREKSKDLVYARIVEMEAAQACTLFNHPGSIFYTSRFIGCPSKGCEHCNFYAALPVDCSMSAVLQLLDLLAPDSQLVFPMGARELFSGEVSPGLEVLWSTHVRGDVFLSLVRKHGFRRLNRDPTSHWDTGGAGSETGGSP